MTSGMPFSISATLGRMVLISSSGLAPGGGGTSGRSGMPKCLALIFAASTESRYSMKSLAALGCLVPFMIAAGAQRRHRIVHRPTDLRVVLLQPLEILPAVEVSHRQYPGADIARETGMAG